MNDTSDMHSPETLGNLISGENDAVALIEPESGRAVLYGELRDEIDALAGRLAGLGVGKGDRVALVLPDGPQFLRFLFAVTAMGATATPLNPGYTAEEFVFYLEDLRPRLVLGTSTTTIAAGSSAALELEFVDVDTHGFASASSAQYERAEPEDIALVLHTSGTTSRPKQVPLLQRNLSANARGIAAFYALSPSDVSLCAMPLFHVHGLVGSVLAALSASGSVVVPTRFVPGRIIRYARPYGVTWVSAGPTLHTMILDKLGNEDLPSLRFVRSCSSALSPDLYARCEAIYGVPMLEAYGMTEGSHQIASNPLPPQKRKAGSVGLASPGVEIRIVDPTGNDVPLGEVAIRGPGLTPGYVANSAANADSFFGDGWFRTGDRGRFDDDGFLVLEGRIKELIIRGGENISPFEIEDALTAHPLVSDAVAFPIPDDRYGEVVGAAVVLSGDISGAALQAWCAGRLAPFKCPAKIFVLEKIARTPTGKLQRTRIGRALLEGSR